MTCRRCKNPVAWCVCGVRCEVVQRAMGLASRAFLANALREEEERHELSLEAMRLLAPLGN